MRRGANRLSFFLSTSNRAGAACFFLFRVFSVSCVCSDSTKTVNSERLCVGGWVREQGEKRVLQIVTLPISTTTV